MARMIPAIELTFQSPGVHRVENTQSGDHTSTRHTPTVVLSPNDCRRPTMKRWHGPTLRNVESMTNNSAESQATGEQTDLDDAVVSIPLLEEAIAYREVEQKPSWRGWIHLGTWPVALASGIVLIALARGTEATISSAVFVLSSLTLFGISATYHRFNWSERTRAILRRLDHANIFFLIAGTYTPIALLALPPNQGWLLLGLVWSGALLGIAMRVLWLDAPRWIYVPLYLLLGWAAVMYLPQLLAANVAMMVLVIVGGGLYTLGAVIYGLKWPNPVPASFGFHEVFHSLTVAAFLCHWTAVLLIARTPLS